MRDIFERAVEYGEGKSPNDTISFIEGAKFVCNLIQQGEDLDAIIENLRLSEEKLISDVNFYLKTKK